MSTTKDYIETIEGTERRFFTAPVTITRAEGDEKKFHKIEGIAAVVNSRTNIGWYDEMIMPGAFDEVLNDDVRCLKNHNENFVLARSNKGKGTLELSLNADGHLAYSYTTPNRSFALDLQDEITTGDVDQSSFAFRIKEQSWEYAEEGSNEPDLRKIIKLERLLDVSPVTFPAYQDTSVAKRSHHKPEVQPKNNLNEYKQKIQLITHRK